VGCGGLAVGDLAVNERVGELAAIALGLVVAGAVMVAPDLPLEVRAGALGTIAAGLVLVGRLSRRGGR
jgi:hypothetical protein